MATLKLNDVTTMTESGGTVTMADGVALGTPASGTLTNATFPAGHITNWTQTITTPTAGQGAQSSYTEMTGSSVDYTPTPGSSYVVYEYSFMMSNSDTHSIQLFWFYYDGSTVANTNSTQAKFNDAGESQMVPFRFILPSWSGSKNMHMRIQCFNTGNRTGLVHYSTYSGNNDSTNVSVRTHRTTYSVM